MPNFEKTMELGKQLKGVKVSMMCEKKQKQHCCSLNLLWFYKNLIWITNTLISFPEMVALFILVTKAFVPAKPDKVFLTLYCVDM